MTGWEKVGALTALYAIGLLWANWLMVRRVRGAVAARAAWTAADFDDCFAELDPRVAPSVRAALAPHYGPGVVPRPEDTLRRFLKLDRGEVEDVALDAAARLGLALEAERKALLVADLPDVAALVRYLGARVRQS
ncbi:hypothetical protein KZ813_01145 [Sphingomonas sp. RHCKR7]|uniref:hypothetical protein n=1 Tax=Sphingomonas folli TaxID=2862497 RepID=UPI001CA58E80|nr:hypothetical protein [Sphingomonas folli]MBW6525436.1 hypothetical protein [Sphingomonas folli]